MNDGTSARSSGSQEGPEPPGASRRSSIEVDAGTELSTRVVVAVAESDGVDPLEMDGRLVDWVDPDALDALIASIDSGCVEFTVQNYRVRVEADGRVFVEDRS